MTDGLRDDTRALVPGPPVDVLVQRLTLAPADCVLPPGSVPLVRRPGDGSLDAAAVVSDMLQLLAPGLRQSGTQTHRLHTFFAVPTPETADLRARSAALTAWLLLDPTLRSAPALAALGHDPQVHADWAVGVVTRMALALAPVLDPAQWPSTPFTREEVSRALLRACGLFPVGETIAQSEARWQTVSTAAQHQVLAEMAEEARRTQELARALAAQRAKEAAAQVSNV